MYGSGLPDGLFAKKTKIQIFGGLGMENIGIIYDHSEYLKAIWYT
jgi:hypothetical protein